MYVFNDPPSQETRALQPGDYNFKVLSCDAPYKSDAGNWVLPLKLVILPAHVTVYANPWCGTNKHGEKRDGIGDFLLAVNRVPRTGEEPNWGLAVGAQGRCHLKVEVAQCGRFSGHRINVVGWFHRPPQQQPEANNEYE